MIGNEIAREKLDTATDSLERRATRLKNGKEPDAHLTAHDAFSSAAYALYVGDSRYARRLFGEAACYATLEAYRQFVDDDIKRISDAEDGVIAAILSRKESICEMTATVTRETLETNSKNIATYDYWTRRINVLAALALNDHDHATEDLASFESFDIPEDVIEYAAGNQRSYQQALTPLYHGILKIDPDLVTEGVVEAADTAIEEFETNHGRKGEFYGHGHDLICQQALAGLELARDRGMEIRVDHEAIPEVVYSTEWREAPAPELSETARLVLDAIDEHDPESGDPFPLLADEE